MANTHDASVPSVCPQHFSAAQPTLHYLRKPRNASEGRAWGNLGYQMHYSVVTLEEQLSSDGNPHVLQLNAFSHEDGWQNPSSWHLYADGFEVAYGDGAVARQCFEESAEAFCALCRKAIEDAHLPALSEREYYILSRARSIARFEPFDEGNHTMGSRPGRIE